jgi:hypothetical protein
LFIYLFTKHLFIYLFIIYYVIVNLLDLLFIYSQFIICLSIDLFKFNNNSNNNSGGMVSGLARGCREDLLDRQRFGEERCSIMVEGLAKRGPTTR